MNSSHGGEQAEECSQQAQGSQLQGGQVEFLALSLGASALRICSHYMSVIKDLTAMYCHRHRRASGMTFHLQTHSGCQLCARTACSELGERHYASDADHLSENDEDAASPKRQKVWNITP
jgi:hypothetical protein